MSVFFFYSVQTYCSLLQSKKVKTVCEKSEQHIVHHFRQKRWRSASININYSVDLYSSSPSQSVLHYPLYMRHNPTSFLLFSLPPPPSDHLRPGVMEWGAVPADEWLWYRGSDPSWAEASASRRQSTYHEQPHVWRHPPGTRAAAVCHRGPGIRWVK